MARKRAAMIAIMSPIADKKLEITLISFAVLSLHNSIAITLLNIANSSGVKLSVNII